MKLINNKIDLPDVAFSIKYLNIYKKIKHAQAVIIKFGRNIDDNIWEYVVVQISYDMDDEFL